MVWIDLWQMPCHKSNLKDRVNRLLPLVVKRGPPSSQRRSLGDEIQPKVITTQVADSPEIIPMLRKPKPMS
jgi:hypothetical protein